MLTLAALGQTDQTQFKTWRPDQTDPDPEPVRTDQLWSIRKNGYRQDRLDARENLFAHQQRPKQELHKSPAGVSTGQGVQLRGPGRGFDKK